MITWRVLKQVNCNKILTFTVYGDPEMIKIYGDNMKGPEIISFLCKLSTVVIIKTNTMVLKQLFFAFTWKFHGYYDF